MTHSIIHKAQIYFSNKIIIDADCNQTNIIVLLKESGESIIELNGQKILKSSPHCQLIRLTKNNFCLLIATELHFYTMDGQFISSVYVGRHISQLFPYKDSIICSYTDEGVYGKDVGKNILNLVEPNKPLQSMEDFALAHDFSFDTAFTRHKPFAAIPFNKNEILLFDNHLQLHKKLLSPIELGNVLLFMIDFEKVIFVEEQQFIVWHYIKGREFITIPHHFTTLPQTINFRHDAQFLLVDDYELSTITL